MKVQFLTPLRTELLKPGWSRVAEPFRFYSERLDGAYEVPVGFEFDWDSIKRWKLIFYWWLKGRAQKAALIHDYFYQHHNGISRGTADKLFDDAMKQEMFEAYGKSRIRDAVARNAIYIGVRVGGWRAWTRSR